MLVISDLLLRIFYCCDFYLKFDSQEFNNIVSPIISLLGFIGLIFTIRIAITQLKLQNSSGYFEYYRNLINKILQDNNGNYSTADLLQFSMHAERVYATLKQNPLYVIDVQRFKSNENTNSDGKDYDSILANLRSFRVGLSILLKRYELLIFEIKVHSELSASHKDLLFKELFANQIRKYTVQLNYMDNDSQYTEIKENLFIMFSHYQRHNLLFFNDDIYELKRKLERDPQFTDYLKGNSL